jgi:hypothetical protein
MSKNKTWSLNPEEVGVFGSGGTSGRRTHATRSGRANSITTASIKLTHYPTGISVEGEVPPGNYARGDMQKKKKELCNTLFSELEVVVARHLRIPGR